MIRVLSEIDRMRRAARPGPRAAPAQYHPDSNAARHSTWPAIIGTNTPQYTKICVWWYGVVALYSWRPVFDSRLAEMPAYMPRMKPVDDPRSPDTFIWVPVTPIEWVPTQEWWSFYGTGQGRRVTGMWAINTAEYQYRNDIGRNNGIAPGTVIPQAYVGMYWGLFRDFGICPDEPRIPYLVPCFHHYRTPSYDDCI